MTGRTYAAHVYGRNTVKLEANDCKESTFIWCPVYTERKIKEVATAASKIIRFNKGGIMVRA